MGTMHAEIDYGFGKANIWGSFDKETVERFFMQHANQCFGIRKSIMSFELLKLEEQEIPEPWSHMADATVLLKHNGDVIVWNSAGKKIKSEFD